MIKCRTREIRISQRIPVDACVAEEIIELNEMFSIRTEGCCCGHQREPAWAMIVPGHKTKAIGLGYVLVERIENEGYHTSLVKILLKSKCVEENHES